MRNPISQCAPRDAEALAVVHRRLLRVLHEVRIGVPPGRDAAFNAFRRLLAAQMAADRMCASLGFGGSPDQGRADRFHVAVSTSVTILECVHRDSLDFVIEAGLLEEMLADPTALQAGARRGCVADAPVGWGEYMGGEVQRVARELPAEDRITFAQLRRTAEARLRVLGEWAVEAMGRGRHR
ncbi:hypothetical protein [Tessaracoccus sp. Z1128]